MIKQLLSGIILGILATIFSLQYDPKIQKIISDGFAQAFEDSLECRFQGKISSVNFFFPSLEFTHVSVTPKDPHDTSWRWDADVYRTSCSLWHLLFQGSLDLRVCLKNVHAHSAVQNNALAIGPHVERMIAGPTDVPLLIKSISLNRARFTLHDSERKVLIDLSWSSETKLIDRLLKTNLVWHDGCIEYAGMKCLSDLAGKLHIEMMEIPGSAPDLIIDNSCRFKSQLCGTDIKDFFIHGSWEHTAGNFSLKTNDPSCAADSISLQLQENGLEISCNAQAPLSLIDHIAQKWMGIKVPLQGQAHITACGVLKKNELVHTQCLLKCDSLSYQNNQLCTDIAMNLQQHNNSLWQSSLAATVGGIPLKGLASFDMIEKRAHLALGNTQTITIDPLKLSIDAQGVSLVLDSDNAGNYSGTLSLALKHSPMPLVFKAGIAGDITHCALTGSGNGYQADALISFIPFNLEKLAIVDEKKSQQVFHASGAIDQLKGSCDIGSILSLASIVSGMKWEGQGKLLWDITHDGDRFVLDSVLHKSNIRIPNTYTFITDFSLKSYFESQLKKIVIESAKISLNKGKLSCDHGTLFFNTDNTLSFAYVPLIFDSCLITIKNDIFASLTGNTLFSYQPMQKPLLKGSLIIDRSQVKENIFSAQFYKYFTTQSSLNVPIPDCTLDLNIETRDPLRIKTSLLETSAHGSFHIAGDLSSPKMSGMISLHDGIIQFPYKPLFITKAFLQAIPDHPDDPAIELIARNKIKNFEVTLSVHGSLKNHTVSLESTPALTETQLVSLLLAGNHEETLQAAVPALVMDNLKNIVFESEHSPLKLAGYFKSLLTPLKKVRLMPRFTDQTGRGGLRGAIEIDVNDRVHALIQKNFSLTEDTRFELEYLLSDDISLKGIRDERRDVNAEVEMRWKF